MLNEIAWFIVDEESIGGRDLDLALRAATRANELNGRDAAILDTVARVYYQKGDVETDSSSSARPSRMRLTTIN